MNRSIAVSRLCKVPFEMMLDEFEHDAIGLIRAATESAASVANDIVLSLDSRWAWFDVNERVRATVGDLVRRRTDAQLDLAWTAEAGKRILPGVTGKLHLHAMSSTYNELSFTGQYVPPPGLLGNASGAVLGRRIAEAAVGDLLDQIVAHLERRGGVNAEVSGRV